MPNTLRYADLGLLEESARDNQHEVLATTPAHTLTLVTRKNDTHVVMYLLTDCSVVLSCRTKDGDEFVLTCPPVMPFTTLSRILEAL